MPHTAELLVREVVSVSPSDTVEEVTRLMKRRHLGCVVVVDGGKVSGVFTERDLLTRVVPEGVDPKATPVSKVMTTEPKTVDKSEPLERVFSVLAERRFRHVPITDDGRPVGMVSLSDFAGVLKEVFADERYAQYFVAYWKQKT